MYLCNRVIRSSKAQHISEFVFSLNRYHKIAALLFYSDTQSDTDFLIIRTKDIEGGLIIQHGFSTIINAKKIGKNCHIYQQVTIGFNGTESPIIGDNVRICCGAKVIGGIHVGNNVVIGANAVVCKDIPDNVVVAGVPAKIIRNLQ